MHQRSLPILALLLASCLPIPRAAAQDQVKVNGLTLLVGVPGVAYERPLRDRVSFQLDATVSPWRSVGGAPQQFLIVVPEWRFHPRGVGRGWFLGAHVGVTAFRLQKWEYRDSDLYQEGFGLLLGLTVGYRKELRGPWGLEVFAGGGNAQSLYKGYHYLTGIRYDSAHAWNQSAEWLPYRGGVMVTYRRGERRAR